MYDMALNKIPPGKLIDFETTKESWNKYILADGNSVRLKTVLIKIIRLDKLDPLGNPQYFFVTKPVAGVFLPSERTWKPTGPDKP